MAKADVEIRVGVDDKATGKLKGIGNTMQKMSGTFRKAGIGMIGVGVALGGGLIALAKGAAEFESSMSSVNTMLLLNQSEFKALSDDVKQLSYDMGTELVGNAQALYQAISAGIPKENVIEFLEIATKAAIGGVTDTETAVSGLASVMNAFKIPMSEVGKIADVMFTTVARGVVTFEELSASMSIAMPTAAALGVEYEEVLGLLATLTKQGTPAARAFTQIRASMISLMKPTAQMEELLSKAGYETGRAIIEALGYAGALNALTIAAEGNDATLAAAFGSVEALGAVYGATGDNAVMAAEDIDAMADSAGAADAAFQVMEESTKRQFEKLAANIKQMGDEIGLALLPVLKDIIEKIKPIIDSFKTWIEKNKDLIPQLLKVASILAVGGAILVGLSMIAKAITLVNIALAIFHGLSGPAGWIKLAAGMLIAGGAIAGIYALMGGFGGGAVIPGTEVAPGVFQPPTAAGGGATPTGAPGQPGGPPLPTGAPALPPGPPSMQYGGIVPGPRGQPIPIIAHGGELFGGTGGIGQTNIYVTVQGSVITENNLANTIYETFLKRKSRNATLELA